MPNVAGVAPPGYRLPDATRIGRVRLQISDTARSIEWYERVLGMRVLDRSEDSVSLGAQGDDTPLVQLHEREGARAVPRRGLLGLYHFAILLPDRDALGAFLAHLGEIGVRAGMSDHLVSEALYLTDPDGLGIEVYADRPRESWKVNDGQIEMATKPLDVDDLLRAAGSAPWKGMPAGTRIGHVHFHVGDLARAEQFYHAALGLDKIVWGYPGALFLAAGGYHHHVGTNTWAAGAPPASDDDARLLDWELILPDQASRHSAAKSLAGGGFEVHDTDDETVAVDPWGIRVRIRAAA